MELCKHYIKGKCTRDECRFKHVDNICRTYFFTGTCKNSNCKFSHEYKEPKKPIRNTESFEPSHKEPDLRIRVNEPIVAGNEICIVHNLFWNKDIIDILLSEINASNFKLWHGDSHSIADDSLNWKDSSPTFSTIIDYLCNYFDMVPGSTRFNYYENSKDWKPYHHDAAALKPEKAKTQNITVGVSFGLRREISFESADQNKFNRKTINFTLPDNTVYAFGNEVNVRFRHGIPQLECDINKPRVSIIVWGYSKYLD